MHSFYCFLGFLKMTIFICDDIWCVCVPLQVRLGEHTRKIVILLSQRPKNKDSRSKRSVQSINPTFQAVAHATTFFLAAGIGWGG